MAKDRDIERVPASRFLPVALTVAGSDSGGGAGIQADCRAFSELGVHGTVAITAVTAQNPQGVTDVHPVPPVSVEAQIRAVCQAFCVRAAKTGMLFDRAVIQTVSDVFASLPGLSLVVDPVMVATSGAPLLRQDAVETLKAALLPRATLITPNLAEAELLTGQSIAADVSARLDAACALRDRFGAAVLLKGGHCGGRLSSDILVTAEAAWQLDACRVEVPSSHGTGCALSAAVVAGVAQGMNLLDAVRQAKAYVHAALSNSVEAGDRTWVMQPSAAFDVHRVRCTRLPLP